MVNGAIAMSINLVSQAFFDPQDVRQHVKV